MKRHSSPWLALVLLFGALTRALKDPSQANIAENGRDSRGNKVRCPADRPRQSSSLSGDLKWKQRHFLPVIENIESRRDPLRSSAPLGILGDVTFMRSHRVGEAGDLLPILWGQ